MAIPAYASAAVREGVNARVAQPAARPRGRITGESPKRARTGKLSAQVSLVVAGQWSPKGHQGEC